VDIFFRNKRFDMSKYSNKKKNQISLYKFENNTLVKLNPNHEDASQFPKLLLFQNEKKNTNVFGKYTHHDNYMGNYISENLSSFIKLLVFHDINHHIHYPQFSKEKQHESDLLEVDEQFWQRDVWVILSPTALKKVRRLL